MKNHLILSAINLVVVFSMLSCSQKQKATNAASNDITDSIAESSDASQLSYREGFIFVKDVYRLDSVSGLYKGLGLEGTFCFDNYEFPLSDCYACLTDSNELFYYCPGTQDELWYSGYLTKEEFKDIARPVKTYFDAPDSWREGHEYTFLSQNMVKRIKKIRVQDPDATIIKDASGKTESLYGKYVYTVNETIFCGEELEVAPYSSDHSLTISDSGYFSKVNRKTGEAIPTSKVEMCSDIPDIVSLLFINDSTITINDGVFHRVKETSRIIFDSNAPFPSGQLNAGRPEESINCVSNGVYTVTSDNGQYEYSVEIMKDTCPDVDFIDYHAIKIYSKDQLQTSQYGEFYAYKGNRFNTNPVRPFGTISADNGCTFLFFIEDNRPFVHLFCVYALKEGNVSCVYHESGVIIGTTSPLLLQIDWEEEKHIYELIIKDGKLIRLDYK